MIKTKQNLCGSLWYLSALCGQRLLHKVHREDTEFHRETRMKKFTWHAGDLAKGLYFCRVQTANETNTIKILKY